MLRDLGKKVNKFDIEKLLYWMGQSTSFLNWLKNVQADDLLFCYRWLLLEMKREFAFDDALRMMEVMWSSLPPIPSYQGTELPLYDVQFLAPLSGLTPPPISPLLKSPRENAYTKVFLSHYFQSYCISHIVKSLNKLL